MNVLAPVVEGWRLEEFVTEPGPGLEHQLFHVSLGVVGDTTMINAYWHRARSDAEPTKPTNLRQPERTEATKLTCEQPLKSTDAL